MLKKTAGGFGALLAVLLGFAAYQPGTFEVERHITINAPPEKVMVLIDDFHNWRAWSPWESPDPAIQRSFIGAERGKGAAYAWSGSDKDGAGRVEITRSSSSSGIEMEVDFIAPSQSYNTAEFTFQPQGDSTRVVWSMRGPLAFSDKLKNVFFSVDRTLGKDFETGLSNMKAAAEKPGAAAPAA
jgi:uncharacterized protein YndB with AHSA1/START domain